MAAPHSPSNDAPWPALGMSLGEALRYLQRGYDPPVQRVLDTHVEHNNASRAEADEVRALRATARDALDAAVAGAPLLDEALLAAYVDGALPAAEVERIHTLIGTNHSYFQQWMGLQAELGEAPGAAPPVPAAALDRVRAGVARPVEAAPAPRPTPHPTPARPALTEWLSDLADRLRWRLLGPAVGFALGALAVAMLPLGGPGAAPPSDTVVLLPGATASSGGRVTFGVPGAPAAAPATVLPAGPLTFRWAPLENAQAYQVEVLHEDGTTVLEAAGLPTATWEVPADAFESGVPLTLVVSAIYEDGQGPVAQLRFQQERPAGTP